MNMEIMGPTLGAFLLFGIAAFLLGLWAAKPTRLRMARLEADAEADLAEIADLRRELAETRIERDGAKAKVQEYSGAVARHLQRIDALEAEIKRLKGGVLVSEVMKTDAEQAVGAVTAKTPKAKRLSTARKIVADLVEKGGAKPKARPKGVVKH
jgi:chromosome segregation ATPase